MIIGGSFNDNQQDGMYNERNMEELLIAKDLGISYVINGRICCYINDFTFICTVLADNAYMRDYVPNEHGKIVQIHLDKVNAYK